MRNQLLTGYILHQKPYGETRSLIYLFSEEFGIVHGIGKKNLPLFVPIQIFANGKNSLKTFSQSQILQHHITLVGQSLFAGLYLNEILQKLLPIEEPMSELWQAYQSCLKHIGKLYQSSDASQNLILLKWHLRQFETVLFEQLGYGLDFTVDSLGEVLEAKQHYRYQLQEGFVPLLPSDKADFVVTGEQLSIWQNYLQQSSSLIQDTNDGPNDIKPLINTMGGIYRSILDNILNYQTLQSRELWQQFVQYQ